MSGFYETQNLGQITKRLSTTVFWNSSTIILSADIQQQKLFLRPTHWCCNTQAGNLEVFILSFCIYLLPPLFLFHFLMFDVKNCRLCKENSIKLLFVMCICLHLYLDFYYIFVLFVFVWCFLERTASLIIGLMCTWLCKENSIKLLFVMFTSVFVKNCRSHYGGWCAVAKKTASDCSPVVRNEYWTTNAMHRNNNV